MAEASKTSESQSGRSARLVLVIAFVLNLLALSSVVEDLMTWANFFEDIISVYQSFRDWVFSLLITWWLPFSLPEFAKDLFVIWTIFFLGINTFNYYEDGKTIFSDVLEEDGYFVASLITIIVLLFGPFLPVLIWKFPYGDEDKHMELEIVKLILQLDMPEMLICL